MSTSYWKKVGRGKWWKNCRLSTCCSRTAKGNFFLNRFAKNYSVCYANFYCNFRHAKLIKVYKEKKIHHHHRHEYKSSKNSTVQTVLKESRLQLTFMTSSLVTFFSCETNNNFDMMGGRTAFFPSKPWGKDNKRICHFFFLSFKLLSDCYKATQGRKWVFVIDMLFG